MLRHADIWRAIDRLAQEHGLSASGLAKKARLDPTTFNPSKRLNSDGRPRWPSTESIAKILSATGATFGDFIALMGHAAEFGKVRRIPVIGMAQAGSDGFFDDAGFPRGSGWDEIAFPDIADRNAYALEISGDSMEPLYRAGDTIIVSPAASVRRGDRVVVRTVAGEVMAKELARLSAKRIELRSLNRSHPDRVLVPEEVVWMARIIWASQ